MELPQFIEKIRILFILSVLAWYWLKVRYYERKIVEKTCDIYNAQYDGIEAIPQSSVDAQTEQAQKPLRYDLEQLESKRRSLVDKFVVLNLILVVLIELFIR